MILLGGNREKIVENCRKQRYWASKKYKKKRPKEVDLGSRMYYFQKLEKYRIINQQLYAQFCVERELNNQMYHTAMQEHQEAQKIAQILARVQNIIEAWKVAASDNDAEQPSFVDASAYLERILSIMK